MTELEIFMQTFWNKTSLYVGGIVGVGIIAFIINSVINYKRLKTEKSILKIVDEINNKLK